MQTKLQDTILSFPGLDVGPRTCGPDMGHTTRARRNESDGPEESRRDELVELSHLCPVLETSRDGGCPLRRPYLAVS